MSDCPLFDVFQRQTMRRRRRNTQHAWDLADGGPTVSFGSTAGQSIVAAVKRKKIYCKAGAYQ
jgi:hypothetical protein